VVRTKKWGQVLDLLVKLATLMTAFHDLTKK